MISLTNKEKKIHREQKDCYICKKRFSIDGISKKYHKVRYICPYTGKYRGADTDICNLRYKAPKEIPTSFHNGSTYHYHFIIKRAIRRIRRSISMFRTKHSKIYNFSVPIKKELDNGASIKSKIKLFDKFRFMSRSLSNLFD